MAALIDEFGELDPLVPADKYKVRSTVSEYCRYGII